jgi:DNA-binding protein HU-beta
MVGKAQIVEGIAARGSSRAAATAALDVVLAEITAALASGERVTLTGFGTFEAVSRGERTARNPRTGATVTVAATTVARFHPGAALREAVASGDGQTDRPSVDLSGLDTTVTGNVKKYRTTPAATEPAPVAPAVPTAPAGAGKAAKAKGDVAKGKGGKAKGGKANDAKAKDAKGNDAKAHGKHDKGHDKGKPAKGKAKDAKSKGKKK